MRMGRGRMAGLTSHPFPSERLTYTDRRPPTADQAWREPVGVAPVITLASPR
jgi:hypothetical protein